MTEKYPFRVCKLEVNDHDDVFSVICVIRGTILGI